MENTIQINENKTMQLITERLGERNRKVELINLADVFGLRGIRGNEAVLYAVSVGQVSRLCHCQKISLNFIPFLSSKVQDSESTSTRFTANLNSYSSNSVSGFR